MIVVIALGWLAAIMLVLAFWMLAKAIALEPSSSGPCLAPGPRDTLCEKAAGHFRYHEAIDHRGHVVW